MKMNLFPHISVLICCFFHSGWSKSLIECPDVFYKEVQTSMNLKVNSSTFSVCGTGPTAVTCRWFPQTGSPTTICTQSVTNCDTTVTSQGCNCVNKTGQIYHYHLSFSMLPNQGKGNINCTLNCFVPGGGQTATVDSAFACQDITFVGKCDRNPCGNGGRCYLDPNNNLKCQCDGTDREGPYCTDTNPHMIWPGSVFGTFWLIALVVVGVLVYVIMKRKKSYRTLRFKRGQEPKTTEDKQKLLRIIKEVLEKINGEEVVSIKLDRDDENKILLESAEVIKLDEAVAEMILAYSKLEILPEPDCPDGTACGNASGNDGKRSRTLRFKRGQEPKTTEEKQELSQTVMKVLRKISGEGIVSIDLDHDDKNKIVIKSANAFKLDKAVTEMISAYSKLELP